jgi:hypothetical protein
VEFGHFCRPNGRKGNVYLCRVLLKPANNKLRTYFIKRERVFFSHGYRTSTVSERLIAQIETKILIKVVSTSQSSKNSKKFEIFRSNYLEID